MNCKPFYLSRCKVFVYNYRLVDEIMTTTTTNTSYQTTRIKPSEHVNSTRSMGHGLGPSWKEDEAMRALSSLHAADRYRGQLQVVLLC
jgi:hypothetical protein